MSAKVFVYKMQALDGREMDREMDDGRGNGQIKRTVNIHCVPSLMDDNYHYYSHELGSSHLASASEDYPLI